MEASLNTTITGLYLTFLNDFGNRKFADMGYVKNNVFSASNVSCLHFVTVAVILLQLIYYNAHLQYCSMIL